MKRKLWIPIALIVLLLAAAFVFRGDIRTTWSAWRAPKLPPAEKFHLSAAGTVGMTGGQNSPVEGGVATSEHFTLVSAPPSQPSVDPLADNGPLPAQANLDVPFTSQAPTGDWGMPYQEACEETSAIMVDAFYRGVAGPIPADQAAKAINAVVDYENKTLGFYKDTTAVQTAQFIKGYFGYATVLVKPLTSLDQLKRAVANGYPVIVPASGKQLPNPNFRNGGPLYHMLVVKGYTQDRIITNDPGTHLGADFTYTFDAFMKAAHDWNGGDVTHGAPVMIIVVPNPT